MKKKVLLIAALFTAGLSFAQDGLTSKKGVPILPEAGDWAIGFDASSLTTFGGNLLNGATNNRINGLGDVRANTIYGKYFVDANTAYRGMLQLGFNSNNDKTIVADAAAVFADPASTSTVENEDKTSSFNIAVGGGMEFRRGKGRLQGVYGPMAMISLSTSSSELVYGNDLTTNNQNGGAPRATEASNGTTFGLMLGGFAGVEYFFAPKISLGAEIQWGINLESTGSGELTTERWDGATSAVVTETVESDNGYNSSFGFDQAPNGMITLNFHF
jgi:hypothetical protein